MDRPNLHVLVQDRPGVLARVAHVLSRRGCNIDALTVEPTPRAGVSRLTMAVDLDGPPLALVRRQLARLVDVLEVAHPAEESA